MAETKQGIAGWAILELMGHRRLGGRVSEATIAGGAFIRIDVPHPNEAGVFTATRFYAPTAVYGITPTTEEIACAVAYTGPGHLASHAPQRGSRWDPRVRRGRSGAAFPDDVRIATSLAELDAANAEDKGDDQPPLVLDVEAGRF